jgi:hypothetical protein
VAKIPLAGDGKTLVGAVLTTTIGCPDGARAAQARQIIQPTTVHPNRMFRVRINQRLCCRRRKATRAGAKYAPIKRQMISHELSVTGKGLVLATGIDKRASISRRFGTVVID